MIKEAIFLSSLFALGVAVLLPFRRKIPTEYLVAAAFPFGTVVWTLVLLCGLIIGADIMIFSALAIPALVLAATVVCRKRSEGISVRFLGWIVLVTGLMGVLSYVISFARVSIVSYDSITQIVMGKSLVQYGINAGTVDFMTSWGVLLPLMQGSAVLFNVEYLSSLQSIWALTLVVVLVAIIYSERSALESNLLRCHLAATGTTVLLASTYFFVFQSTYIHNSLPSAVFLLVAIHALWRLIVTQNKNWIVFALFGLVGFSLCRTEAPLFGAALIFIAFAVEGRNLPRRISCAVLLPYMLFVIGWYAFLYTNIGSSSDILSPGKVLILIFSIVGATFSVWLFRSPRLNTIAHHLPLLVVVVLVAAVLTTFIFKFEHSFESTSAIFFNLGFEGRWGATWWVIAISAVVAILMPRFKGENLFILFSLSFIAIVIVLGIMRVPYRLGWGDSANRMFTHLLPILLAYLALKFSVESRISVPNGSRGALFAGVGLVCAAIGFSVFIWNSRSDAAQNALVLKAEDFCPPDSGGAHDFKIALRAVADDMYAAACSTGQREIIIDLQRPVNARFIEMVAYSKEQLPVDFAFDVSVDLSTWSSAFDTREVGSIEAFLSRQDTLIRVPIDVETRFRYVRFVFRESLGQNRLLLKRFAVITKPTWWIF